MYTPSYFQCLALYYTRFTNGWSRIKQMSYLHLWCNDTVPWQYDMYHDT